MGVESELLHYLDVSWQSIITGDIDGPESIPYKIDRSAPNLNRWSATRRVARAIFMGTAPTYQQENRGLDDKQINLGVVQPGEKPAVFGDALRRLGNRAKFMHGDHSWARATEPEHNSVAACEPDGPAPHGNRKRTGSQLPCIPKGPRRYNSHRQ